MKYLTVYLIIATLATISLYTQTQDSCLKVYNNYWDSTFTNPYLVKVDSCNDSPNYGEYYGKYFFYLDFKYNIIPRNYIAPKDTIIEYTWQYILQQYSDDIDLFHQIEQKFGNFHFRENAPDAADTTEFYSRELLLRFENYVNIDSVEKSLSIIPCLKNGRFVGWFGIHTSVNEIETQNQFLIYPNPVSDFLMIRGLEESHVQSISIFNTFGQKLYEGDLKEQIDVSSLTPGVYFLHIGNMNYKFVKL